MVGLASVLPGSAFSEGIVSATAEVDRSLIKIGDQLRLSVVVEYPEGYEVDAPGTRVDLGQFGILDVETRPAKKAKGRVTEGVDFDISTYFTGRFVIPPIRIGYRDPAGATGEVTTESIEITVEGVGADEEGADIRDVAPPVVVVGPRTREVVVYGSIAVVLLATLVYWLWRRGRVFASPPAAPLDPWVRARQRLDALAASEIVRQGLCRPFATELSEIVRDYLLERFAVPAPNMATYEILEACRSHPQLGEHAGRIDAIQRGCDLVKFAKYEARGEEMRGVLEHAYGLVAATTPAPPSERAPEPEPEPAEVGA
ncbi:hypothetical protein HS125_02360 [bacterium]|nr:hypothetical protein [bacterium]